jgi:8-oxoguanine deaminase
VWRVDTLPHAGVLDDPITVLMQGGPAWAWHTIVGGRFVVRDGLPITVDLPTVLKRHRAAALRVQHGV